MPPETPRGTPKTYGEKAYPYALSSVAKNKGKENWLDPKDMVARLKEYELRVKKLTNKPQTLDDLNFDTYNVRKNDTLHQILTLEFKMNDRIAFLTMIKLLQKGVNVDGVRPGDKVGVEENGMVTFTRGSKATSISIKAELAATPTSSTGKPDTTVEADLSIEDEPRIVPLVPEPDSEAFAELPPEEEKPRPDPRESFSQMEHFEAALKFESWDGVIEFGAKALDKETDPVKLHKLYMGMGRAYVELFNRDKNVSPEYRKNTSYVDTSLAIEAYKKALETNPLDEKCCRNGAEFALANKEYKVALEFVKKVADDDGNTSQERVKFLNLAAQAAENLGDKQAALAYYKKSLPLLDEKSKAYGAAKIKITTLEK